MADEKIEVSKEVLAPADSPREELISTAVKFLLNPKVQQSPLSQRRAFLTKKGLTNEEIDIAVERSGVPADKPTQVYPPQPPGIQPVGPLVPYQQPVSAVSTFGKIRDVLHTIALIGGLSYAGYKFFKEILQPWILGKPHTEERLDKIENMVIDLQKNIVETLSKIQVTLTTMQESMSTNQEKIQAISHEVYSQRSSSALVSINESQFATEMKSEMQTLKGLLLNRRQFPPTPSSSSPSLPSWQLEQMTPSTVITKSLVKPSGDAPPEEINSNESDRTGNNDEEEVKVTFSETSLEKTDSDVDKVENFQEEVEIEENHVDNVKKENNSDSDVD